MGAAWSEQNSLDQQIEMFNRSRLVLVGSEMVGDEDCYKVRAEIDIASYADPLSQEMTSYVPFLPLNISDLFRNMTMEVHYWISKESHLLKRADVFETLYMTPQSLGLQEAGEDNTAIRISSTISILFDGFNERINIILPSEARAAQPFRMPSYPQSEAVAVSAFDDKFNETAAVGVLPIADDALPQHGTGVLPLKGSSPEDNAGMGANNTTISSMPSGARLPLPDPRS